MAQKLGFVNPFIIQHPCGMKPQNACVGKTIPRVVEKNSKVEKPQKPPQVKLHTKYGNF